MTQPEQVEEPGPASESTPTPGETALLAMEVIQALFEDAEVVDGPDGRVVRFGAPMGSA